MSAQKHTCLCSCSLPSSPRVPGPGPAAAAVARGGASYALAGRFLALEYPWGALTSWFPKLLQWQEPEGVGKSQCTLVWLPGGNAAALPKTLGLLVALPVLASSAVGQTLSGPGKELEFCTSTFCANKSWW